MFYLKKQNILTTTIYSTDASVIIVRATAMNANFECKFRQYASNTCRLVDYHKEHCNAA